MEYIENNSNTEKIDYITNQMKKTFGKKYENYCVNRIYSLINRNDVKIVTQQLFKRKGKKIALADLYLPQVNVWVEIDEGHHLVQGISDMERTNEVIEENKVSSEAKKKYDALEEVINVELEEPFRIVVYNKSLEEINSQIDEIKRFPPLEFYNATYGKVLRQAVEKKGMSKTDRFLSLVGIGGRKGIHFAIIQLISGRRDQFLNIVAGI